MHNLPETVLSEFKSGNFVVKRSARKFNQVDPDQAQEWVNWTGKKGGGIVGITKTPSALCRWTLSYNLRSQIAANTQEMCGQCPGSNQLHIEGTESRQMRDQHDEDSLVKTSETFRVFSTFLQPGVLHNFATKDVATNAIQDSLLDAKHLGQNEVTRFIEERLTNNDASAKPLVSFHAPLKRNNPPTFAMLYSIPTKDKGKEQVVKADRNLLQCLITAFEAGSVVDMPSILKHELMPVPLSLTEMDGSLRTGNKSVLVDIITKAIACPDKLDLQGQRSCLIIDGQPLVIAVGKPQGAMTFGDLADTFVLSVLQQGANYERIDVVFDRYRDETIKADPLGRRTKAARPIRRIFEDRSVPLPKNWANFMASTDNKADLARFLSESLISQAPNDKDVIVAGGFLDEQDVRSSKGSDVDSLRSTHEEADTRLVLHAAHSRFETVVPSRDTDVILLLVAHFRHIHFDNLWVMAGTSKARKFIPVGTVCNSLPNDLVGNLLAFHALTGCDTTSYMANHSKQTSWTLFKEHYALLNGLGVGDITKETIQSVESFVCKIYKVPQTASVDTARHVLFLKGGKPEVLPPTKDSLKFHAMRTHYQALLWRAPTCPHLISLHPARAWAGHVTRPNKAFGLS